jgi:hypothetical protein
MLNACLFALDSKERWGRRPWWASGAGNRTSESTAHRQSVNGDSGPWRFADRGSAWDLTRLRTGARACRRAVLGQSRTRNSSYALTCGHHWHNVALPTNPQKTMPGSMDPSIGQRSRSAPRALRRRVRSTDTDGSRHPCLQPQEEVRRCLHAATARPDARKTPRRAERTPCLGCPARLEITRRARERPPSDAHIVSPDATHR